MNAPLSFAWRNIVFGRDINDAWALFRVQPESYGGLPAAGKRQVLAALASFAYSIEADFQLLRVTRGWSVERYVEAAAAGADARFARRAELAEVLDGHRAALGDRQVARPEVYCAVALTRSQTWREQLRATVGLADPRTMSRRRLREVLDLEAKAFARATDFLDCDRATSLELQWLIRRAFSRGVAEPQIDRFWEPQALIIDADDEDAREAWEPLEGDVLRLFESPINIEPRLLRIEDENADSFQALLTLGALPDIATFPGRQAELLFAPLEAVAYPVDATVCVRWLPNSEAIALARRKVVDADNVFGEESHGDHGPSARSAERPAAARELEEYLTDTERPPLLRATISLAVGAASANELQTRVEQLRREYAPVTLHRPFGAQLDLFVSHLPAQRCWVRGYENVLVCEQLGAMVPTATHAVGSETGTYVGHTLSGSRQPVLFDISEGSRTARPPAILCSGTLGSGKTLTAQLLAYHAFLAGSRIVAIDPKGDHHLDALVGIDHVEHIELRAGPQDRGMLDPFRIAPDDTRADLAYSFLIDALPAPVPPGWQTEIRDAVDTVAALGARSCGEVLTTLERGSPAATEAAHALRVHARSGLLQLGFADPDTPTREPTATQITYLRIANLTLPLPGTPRSEMNGDERIGQALLRLLATAALHLMGGDWTRHKVFLFDEGWMLLGDAAGRALIQRINRLCRSQNATPIIATQILADIADLENLFGALFCFGVETDAEAARALTLLGLDATDARGRAQLKGFRRGRCLMRDYDGRVGAVQIDPLERALLDALDTTPTLFPLNGNGIEAHA